MCQRLITFSIFCLASLLLSFPAHTQAPANARGVLRLKVRYKTGDVTKDLARKRFFLIKGSLEENRSLIEKTKLGQTTSRTCYYRSKGASAALIKWLADNDCESVYCREIEERFVTGIEAVPEFQAAYAQALIELKTPELARRWLTNYLRPEVRFGFYDVNQGVIRDLVAQAEAATRTPVASVMTDRKGTAYLTDIVPGIYTISNLVGSETEKTRILWACEREVKATDLGVAMRRPFTLSNEADPKVKCEIVERPLSPCDK